MLTNTDYRAIADGNGSTVDFTFAFPIIAATDLKVYKVTKATGALGTLLTLNVDYTVAINTVTEGGTVTYTVAPTTLQQSLIYRDVPSTQPEQFPSEGNYPEERIERMGDRLAMLINQLKGSITRAILLPISSALTNITLPTPSAGKGIKWNATEDGFENSTSDPDTMVASAESARDAAIVAQTAAETAETNAETAETNAEAAQTAAEAAQSAAEAAAASIPDKASQAEAEAGLVDNVYMTPLKTAQAIAALAEGGVAGDGTVNPTNLLYNGDFEAWGAGASSAPDGWTLYGASAAVAREGTIIKMGTYSAKLTRSGTDCLLYQTVEVLDAHLIGRTYTFSAWVYATVADRVRLALNDGAGAQTNYSSYHTGDSTWQLLTVSLTGISGSSALQPRLSVDTGDTSGYIDGAMLVEGESVFAFSPKPAEIIRTQTVVTGSRALDTVYQNTTGRAMFVGVTCGGTTQQDMSAYTGYANPPTTRVANDNAQANNGYSSFCFVVLPGNYYKVTSGAPMTLWTEWY